MIKGISLHTYQQLIHNKTHANMGSNGSGLEATSKRPTSCTHPIALNWKPYLELGSMTLCILSKKLICRSSQWVPYFFKTHVLEIFYIGGGKFRDSMMTECQGNSSIDDPSETSIIPFSPIPKVS